MALYGDVPNAALQKLINAIALSIRQPNGSILTEYRDNSGRDLSVGVPADKQATLGAATEFQLTVRINPDGNSAHAKVICLGPRNPKAIEGQLDMTVLATKLV